MKLIRTIALFILALAIVKCTAHAADTGKTARWIDSITAAPVAVLKTADIDGASTLGAGVDLGVGLNKFVSLHATAIAFEDNHWRGSTVDESELYGKATFARYKNESFTLYGKGGAVRDWGQDLWGFGVGLGAELKFNKRVSLAADYTLRAWFKERDKDSLARALVNISF